jgi:hypothetical protein
MTEKQNIVTVGPPTEPINIAIKEHQGLVEDWKHRSLLKELHIWTERFDVEFKLKLPLPVIVVDKLSRRTLGFFRFGRNGLGLKHEITINSTHAQSKEFWQVLGTLLHECLHLWQQTHGDPSNSNYHNKQYREKALSLGLVVDRWGHTQYAPENSSFLNVLAKYGVEVPQIPPLNEQRILVGRLNSSKLKLWQCQCPVPVKVRVARAAFRAMCLDCDGLFRRKE